MASTLKTDSYAFINATDIKSYIINQLSNSDNPVFSGCSYVGSNMNALVDVISVLVQQILYHLSLNTSEASFATANLYESMSKLVSILNYKAVGKQTSLLPVRMTIDVASIKQYLGSENLKQITIPRFSKISHNSDYYLKNEIVIPLTESTPASLNVDSILFEGNVHQVSDFIAVGDEYETFTLFDKDISVSNSFISDNFFVVFVDENSDGQWVEYTETTSLFVHNEGQTVYQRRFNEDMNYEFKFGNGINGKRLPKGARIAVFYIVSSGEQGIIGDEVLTSKQLNEFSSSLYSSIKASNYTTIDNSVKDVLKYITVKNTGDSTAISYPESVQSIRQNAPRIFASQNRLISLGDFKNHVDKNFSAYIKDSYFCTNDTYTKDYLKYYYNIGLDSPQEDSRLNIAQVEFMTSTNFNNIYGFILPKVNTIINDKVPNYINTTIKHEIVNSVQPYKIATHNLVLLDPIYKAITFGSYMQDDAWNPDQLQNKLVLVRNRLTKYSYSFIKDYLVSVLTNYFSNLSLGDDVDLAQISKLISGTPGVKRFFMRNINGGEEKKLTFFCWNPLYINEDNFTTQQAIINEPFVFPYFYDLKNIANLIIIEDE